VGDLKTESVEGNLPKIAFLLKDVWERQASGLRCAVLPGLRFPCAHIIPKRLEVRRAFVRIHIDHPLERFGRISRFALVDLDGIFPEVFSPAFLHPPPIPYG